MLCEETACGHAECEDREANRDEEAFRLQCP